jgi:IMP dehydrogenase / GMP reductase domain
VKGIADVCSQDTAHDDSPLACRILRLSRNVWRTKRAEHTTQVADSGLLPVGLIAYNGAAKHTVFLVYEGDRPVCHAFSLGPPRTSPPEGSLRARNHRRYAQLPELFFEEGVVGYVPHTGSIYDKLPVLLQMVRAALATTGCRTIDTLHTHAVLERQSPVALQDSQIHDMLPVPGVS